MTRQIAHRVRPCGNGLAVHIALVGEKLFAYPIEEASASEAETPVKATRKGNSAAHRDDSRQIINGALLVEQGSHFGSDRGAHHAAKHASRQGHHHDESWCEPYADISHHQAGPSVLGARPQRFGASDAVTVSRNGNDRNSVEANGGDDVRLRLGTALHGRYATVQGRVCLEFVRSARRKAASTENVLYLDSSSGFQSRQRQSKMVSR